MRYWSRIKGCSNVTKNEAERIIIKSKLVFQNNMEFGIYKDRGLDNGYGVVLNKVSETMRSLIVPHFVTRISSRIRVCISNLEEVAIDTDNIEIEEQAFFSSGLTRVKIDTNNCSIGNCAFALNENLAEVEINGNNVEIGEIAFSDSGIKDIKLSHGVKYIGAYVFEGNKLRKINMPDSICNRDKVSFPDDLVGMCAYNRDLKEVTLSKNITALSTDMFRGCTELKYIELHEGLERIGSNVFTGSGVKELVVPSTVGYLSWSSISGSSIEKLVILNHDIRTANNRSMYNSLKQLKMLQAPRKIIDEIRKRGIIFNSDTQVVELD